MRNSTKAKVFAGAVVAATVMSQLVFTVAAHARFICSGFLHKREVPAKLAHTYED